MAKQILIPEARLSFDVLGKPERYQNNPANAARWAATFLIAYEAAVKAEIDKAIEEVAEEKWGKKAAGYLENILGDKKMSAWIDGKKKAEYDGYAGNFALTCYRYEDKGRPLVLDNDATPIYHKETNELMPGKAGRLFAGCYVRGQVEVWAQENRHGKGIRATLLQVQRLRKGDAFGGGAQPEPGVFGAIDDDEDDEAMG